VHPYSACPKSALTAPESASFKRQKKKSAPGKKKKRLLKIQKNSGNPKFLDFRFRAIDKAQTVVQMFNLLPKGPGFRTVSLLN
jgi:hypothetical protein